MARFSIDTSPYNVRCMLEAMLQAAGFRPSQAVPDICIRKRSVSPDSRKGEVEISPYERFNGMENCSQIASKNAQELIKQEEQAKLKIEKKRAKKERQKEKKKWIKLDNSNIPDCAKKDYSLNTISKNTDNLVLNTDNKEAEEELDVKAAFVTKAIKKVKANPIILEEQNKEGDKKNITTLINSAIDYENKEQYKEALQNISEAINLSPKRYDLILKRSFILYQLAKFKKSTQDAQKVLEYSPNNIDGYYRLGEGHFAMNNLPEAEAAFTKLLSLNAYTEQAKNRLLSIRSKQLQDMGYHPNEAFTALIKSKNKTLDEALDFLIALKNGSLDTKDLYYSDEEESENDCEEEKEEASGGVIETAAAKQCLTIDKRSPLFTDPSNPLQCCSLFVGNMKKNITYKEVEDVFIKFGNITSIKLSTGENSYGFINFEDSISAGEAMKALQGSRWFLSTLPLAICYPTNIVNTKVVESKTTLNGLQPVGSNKFSANKPSTVVKSVPHKPAHSIPVVTKTARPPPKTEDCYFWTTTGCVYGDKCFNIHRPELKGVNFHSKRPIPFPKSIKSGK